MRQRAPGGNLPEVFSIGIYQSFPRGIAPSQGSWIKIVYHCIVRTVATKLPYALNDPHGSVESIGKRLVSTFPHKDPLIILPLALDDLSVQLLELLVHLDLAERRPCIVVLALPHEKMADCFRKQSKALLPHNLKFKPH